MQNYRLIETNYILLLNSKKNIKFYKESLVQIVKKIEGLQFAEASQLIYDILGGMSNEEIHADILERQFFTHLTKE